MFQYPNMAGKPNNESNPLNAESKLQFGNGNLMPSEISNIPEMAFVEQLLNTFLGETGSLLMILDAQSNILSHNFPVDPGPIIQKIQSGKGSHTEQIKLKINQKTYWYKIKKSIIPNSERQVFIFQNISDHKKTQKELSNVYEKYKQVVENINDALVIDNFEGKVVFANQQFCQLFELNDTQLSNCLLEDYIASEYREESRVRHEKRVRGDHQVEDTFEILGLTTSGKKIWLEVKVSALKEQDEIIGTLSVIRNIHQRKLDELELEQRNKDLMRVNEELDKFVYSTSHDLRAPLISVLRLVQICEEDFYPNDQELHGLLKLMKDGLNRTDRVIRRILEYAKNKRFEIIPEPIELLDLVNSILNEMEFLQANDRIEFKVKIPAGLKVYTDKQRLTLVLDHLITNAVKYQRPNEPNKYILINASANERGVEILVEDNGEGISPEIRPRIFDMFYRGTATSNGAGLGLYIVRQTLKSLKGEIQVVSTYGKCTFFRFFIPYLTDEMLRLEKRPWN